MKNCKSIFIFQELIGTTLSLVNMFGLRQKLSKILKYVWWRNYVRTSNKSTQATMNINTVCAVCSEKPTLPHAMGCSHIFCYYCLQVNYINSWAEKEYVIYISSYID